MSQSIYKYRVEETIRMPEGAKIINVAEQDGQVTMWAVVDISRHLVKRVFRIIGTGMLVPDSVVYIGTAYCGSYVWHVFEL